MEEKKIKMTEAEEKEELQADGNLDEVAGGVQVKSTFKPHLGRMPEKVLIQK